MALPPEVDQLAMEPADDALLDNTLPEEDGSYTISIRVSPDGMFTVGRDGDEASEVPADSIKGALTAALEIYRADGKATAEAQFDAGFSGREEVR